MKCKYQNKVRLECSRGDILRVTASEQKARESFGFVGCKSNFHRCLKNLLGQTGKVLEVTANAVQLQHDNGSQHWWGLPALEGGVFVPLERVELNKFTASEVDGMKVRLRQHASRG